MTDIKKNIQKSAGVNPVVAAMAGAVVAGVAVAGAMVMADKTNQAKAKKVVDNVKDQMLDKRNEVQDKVIKLESIAKNAVNDVKNI